MLAVLGLGRSPAPDPLNLAVFSLMVAVSTVLVRLKFPPLDEEDEDVALWWLLLLMRGAADGGPTRSRKEGK